MVKSIADGGMGLTAGKTYFAKMGIWYRSREYQSGRVFEVTVSKALKEVTESIKTMSSDIKANVTGISSTGSRRGRRHQERAEGQLRYSNWSYQGEVGLRGQRLKDPDRQDPDCRRDYHPGEDKYRLGRGH